MPKTITGGCRCGALRYSCAAPAIMAVSCSCSDCKTFYGGAISAAVVLPREAVEVSGTAKYYAVTGGSGKPVERGFCPNCGTQVFGKPAIAPQLMTVTLGTLDDQGGYKPQMNVYAASAHPWLHLDEDIASFPQMPPPEQIPQG